MELIEIIREKIIDFQEQRDTLKQQYEKNDVRIAFYDLVNGTFLPYYAKLGFYLMLRETNYLDAIANDYTKNFIDDLKNADGFKNWKKSYLQTLNGDLLVRVWSHFELCISEICKSPLLTEEERNKIRAAELEKELATIQNCVPNIIDEKSFKKIKKILEERHPSINSKYDRLFKKVNKIYYNEKAIDEDKQFLEMFGTYRNMVHTNFHYFGKERQPYSFKEFQVQFIYDRDIVLEPALTLEGSTILFLDWIIRLGEIYKRLVSNISYQEYIAYPIEDGMVENDIIQ